MAASGVRVAVMSEFSVLTDLPEFSDLKEFSPGVSWDERTRGGGVGPTVYRPIVVIAEQNLRCYESDVFPYEDIFVHEFTHGILNMGIERMKGGEEFRARLESAYRNALDGGLWERTYAGDNPDEYWAEGVQAWFGLNDPPGPIHNNINTRAELESYDPVLAGLIHEIFGDAEVISSCHGTWDINHDFIIEGVIKNHDGQPMVNVDLWAWQASRLKSGSDRTDQKEFSKSGYPTGASGWISMPGLLAVVPAITTAKEGWLPAEQGLAR